MAHDVLLTLSDTFYQQVERTAKATNQTPETVLLTALQTALPALDELPTELRQDIVALESLDNHSLFQVMLETSRLTSSRNLSPCLYVSKQVGSLQVSVSTWQRSSVWPPVPCSAKHGRRCSYTFVGSASRCWLNSSS